MTTVKTKPKLSYTILCDDVRQEMGGKFSLMGLFESIHASVFPAVHPRFAIVNEWTGGKGEFTSRMRLLSPDREQVISESESSISLFSETQRHRDISIRYNTTFSAPGTYWIETLLDGEPVSIVPLTLQLITGRNVH
jgi:hypothetical protein